MTAAHHYRLYEIPVISEIELPELQELADAGPAREEGLLQIHLGTAPAALEGGDKTEDGWYEVTRTEMICSVPNIGKFHVSEGRRILIDPDPSAQISDVRTYLFGVAFAAAVHQRALLPLHISALRTPHGVWAFTGDSGAGKSTLVGLINKMTGWPILCDDVAVARFREGRAEISAGLRRLKLWDDAVALLGADQGKLVRDLERENKFHLKDADIFKTESMPLTALVQLERGEPRSLTPLSGVELFQTVMNAVYRPYFVPIFADPRGNATRCSQVAGAIDGFAFHRPWDTATQAESAKFLCERIAGANVQT